MAARSMARARRRIEQVLPLGVHALDEPDLPRPPSFLELLLAPDGIGHGLVKLVVDALLHAVPLGEAVDEALAVLGHTVRERTRDPDVEDAIPLAGHDVDAGVHGWPDEMRRRLQLSCAGAAEATGVGAGLRRHDEVCLIRVVPVQTGTRAPIAKRRFPTNRPSPEIFGESGESHVATISGKSIIVTEQTLSDWHFNGRQGRHEA